MLEVHIKSVTQVNFLTSSKNDLKNFLSVLSMLDVGCGPGDTWVGFILPRVRTQTLKIVGIDSLVNKVKLADKSYKSDYLSFCVFNIRDKLLNLDETLKFEKFRLSHFIFFVTIGLVMRNLLLEVILIFLFNNNSHYKLT